METLGICAIFRRKNSRMCIDKNFAGKLVTAFGATVFLAYLIYRVMLVFFPHPDAGGVEVNVVYFIQRILDGQPFYSDPELPPYAIAQYSPLYYYLVAGVAKLSGSGPDNVFALFITGRIVSLVLNIAFVVVVFLICRKTMSVSLRRSAMVSFTAFIFLQITSFARPDSLYHFFFMLTIYYFLTAAKKEEEVKPFRSFILLAGVFAALALFSKQTAIVLPLVIGLWFVLKRKYNNLFLFSLVYVSITSLFMLGISFFLGYDLFIKNAIQGINNGVSITWYRNVILIPVYTGYGLVFLAFFTVVLLYIKKDKRQLMKLSGFILLLLFVLLNGIALKFGSVPGYLTEWWTILFILTAYYWPSFCMMASRIHRWIPAIIVIILFALKGAEIVNPISEKIQALSSSLLMKGYENEKAVAEKVKKRLQPGDGFVVFTNIYTPDSYQANFLFRHAVMPQMEIVALSTYPMGKYNYTDFEKG
ncbi:MAG: glycosyltransferase family 39 protein, partial [Chitinophagaceae bacterium]|nr:glycosyltransferase family 39 protein [Chitinophagaceae bacterium]